MKHVACVLIPLAVAIASSMAQAPAGDRAELSLAIRQGNLERVTAIVERSPALVRSSDDSGFAQPLRARHRRSEEDETNITCTPDGSYLLYDARRPRD